MLFYYDLLLLSAGEEHAVDSVSVGSRNVKLLTFESNFEDYLSLIVSSEKKVAASNAATTPNTLVDTHRELI